MSTKRKAYNLLLPIVVYAAAGLTVLLLAGIIGYVLVKGLPNVSISLLTSVPSVIRNVKGILPYILNTLYVVILSVAHRASPRRGRGRLSERVRQKPQAHCPHRIHHRNAGGHSQHHLRPGGYAGVQPEAEPGRLPDLRQPDTGYHGAAHQYPHHPGKPEDRAPELPRRRPWPGRHQVAHCAHAGAAMQPGWHCLRLHSGRRPHCG